jgi:hypothetical protein
MERMTAGALRDGNGCAVITRGDCIITEVILLNRSASRCIEQRTTAYGTSSGGFRAITCKLLQTKCFI